MISKKLLYGVLLGLPLSLNAWAANRIKVVTSLPDLAWMVQEIGGGLVESKALLRGKENPHYVDANPDFVRQVAEAKIVCIAGLDLEVGYMPAVLKRSGNASVQPGGAGYCEIGQGVAVIDKPTGPVDRSMGDVHPGGNPHFFLSPKALAEGGTEVVKALSRIDPAQAAAYAKGGAAFRSKMEALSEEIRARLEPFRAAQQGRPLLMEYHKEFAYFLKDYDLLSFGSLEEKPGLPPSAARLASVSAAAKAAGVKVLLAADYSPVKTLQRFQEISGIPVLIVPTMIQSRGEIQTYAELQKHIADGLIRTLQPKGKPAP